MQDMNDFEHYDTTMGQPRRALKPPHQCEPWQMLEHDKGWLYCSACGRREPTPLPPKPEPAREPHAGPHWEHDCETCIYLGSMPHYDKQYDLYWCPPNKYMEEGNVVARHGIMGDYVSGMNWILREPILATAAILALRAGHITEAHLCRRMY